MQKSEEVMSHLKDHQKYPATKEELGAACGNLSDFSEEDCITYQAMRNEEYPALLKINTLDDAKIWLKAEDTSNIYFTARPQH